jgi:hypothetical protein
MTFAVYDRVKESSITTGTGVFTLAGAIFGFQSFASKFSNNDTTYYTIFQASTGAWEVGLGTWLTGSQLQRTTVFASSNAGALVNFAAGSKEVFVTDPSAIRSLMGATVFSVVDVTARDAIPAAVLRLGMLCRLLSTGVFYHWTGSVWTVFQGFAPIGSVTGQLQIWNQALGVWQAGSLDLADPDAVGSSMLPWLNIAPSIGNLGFTGLKSLSYNGEVDNGNSSTADSIDFTTGDLQKGTLTGNCTYTITPPAGAGQVMFRAIQDGTGGRTLTLSGVTWIGSPFQPDPTPGSSTFYPLFHDGTTLWAFGQPGPAQGAALTNANVTKTVADGSSFTLPAGTLASSAKTLTLGITGTPETDEEIEVIVYAQSQNYLINNNAATLLATVVAGTKRVLHFRYDGSDWVFTGKMRLT